MSSIPEYILKKPVEIEKIEPTGVTAFDEYRVYLNKGYWSEDIDEHTLSDVFVPLDRQALTEQIQKILDGTIANMYITAEEVEYKEICSRVTGEILGLFGLENTGSETA
jgi:hypothetical protein